MQYRRSENLHQFAVYLLNTLVSSSLHIALVVYRYRRISLIRVVLVTNCYQHRVTYVRVTRQLQLDTKAS